MYNNIIIKSDNIDYIENIFQNIVEYFEEQKLENLLQENKREELVEIVKVVIDYLTDLKSELNDSFNYSVLNGEFYLSDFNDRIEKLNNTTDIIREKLKIIIFSSSKNIEEEKNNVDSIFQFIKQFVSVYFSFTKYLTQCNNDNHGNINVYMQLDDDLKNIDFNWIEYRKRIEEDTNNLYRFIFSSNIHIAQLDEGFECSKVELEDLIKLSIKINELYKNNLILKEDEIPKQIVNKIEFLILKILIRFKKTKKEDYYVSHDIMGSNDYKIETLLGNNTNPYIIEFKEKISLHYNSSLLILNNPTNTQAIEKLNLIANKIIAKQELLIEDIHFFSKIVKVNSKDIVNESCNIFSKKDCSYMLDYCLKYFKSLMDKLSVNINYKEIYAIESGIFLSHNSMFRLWCEDFILNFKNNNSIGKLSLMLKDLINDTYEKNNLLHPIPEFLNPNSQIQHHRYFVDFIYEIGILIKDKFEQFEVEENYNRNEYYNLVTEYKKILRISENITLVCMSQIDIAKQQKQLPVYLMLEEECLFQ